MAISSAQSFPDDVREDCCLVGVEENKAIALADTDTAFIEKKIRIAIAVAYALRHAKQTASLIGERYGLGVHALLLVIAGADTPALAYVRQCLCLS
jgi:hypothetical protein